MNKPLYILIGSLYALVVLAWLFPRNKQEAPKDYRVEMYKELEAVKKEVSRIQSNLTKQYEKDDTVSTDAGVSDSNKDFIERTGNKYPPGHFKRLGENRAGRMEVH